MTTKITLIRHGETMWNATRRWQGIAPIPLNENGKAQALEAAHALKDAGIEHIFSSDLSRAYQTAAIIGGVLGLPIITDARLREIDIGIWQGLTKEEMLAWDGENFNRFQTVPFEERAFPGGETQMQHVGRTLAAIRDIALQCMGKHVLVATHGGCIRSIIYGISQNLDFPIENCSVTRLHFLQETWHVQDTAQHYNKISW